MNASIVNFLNDEKKSIFFFEKPPYIRFFQISQFSENSLKTQA